MRNASGPEHQFSKISEPGVYVLIREGENGHIVIGEVIKPRVGPAIRHKVLDPQNYRVGNQAQVGAGTRPLIYKIGVAE